MVVSKDTLAVAELVYLKDANWVLMWLGLLDGLSVDLMVASKADMTVFDLAV